MSNSSKIKSKPYRNWVRGALGLFYLQKGLHPFTDRVVKAEHAQIVQNLMPCTNCAIENILPEHASSKVCIQKNKARCNCRKKTNTNCATCGKIYDDILLRHRFREPYWTTDCSIWYNDHWQFAKCFLTTTSQGSNNTAAETDASGLLSIIINGLFFQSEIQCNIDPPNDLFSQVREIRNAILHNPTLDLTDHDVARYLQSMIAVLEDKKALSLDPAAHAAVVKLKEILNDELIITTNEEASAIQIALDAIKVAKEQSEESIRKLGEEKQTALKASEESIRKLGEEKHNTLKASIKEITEESRNALQQQTSESAKEINTVKEQAIENVSSTVSTVFKETYEPEIKKLKLGQDDHEIRLKAVEAEQQSLQRKQLELEKQVDKVEKHVTKLTIIEEKHQTRLRYLKQKQVTGLQQYLVDVYQQHYVRTWISPLMPQQNDVNIRDVYVSPRMEVEENKDSNDGNTSQDRKGRDVKNKYIERYHDLFSTRGKRNRKIFILGDVGTGKSSFCKMMIQNWCTAITKRGYTDNSGASEEEDAKQGEEKNTCDLNQFDFLFYVPLREMSGHINDTVDMIKAQLDDYKVLIDDIFTNDSERILILADGLDEWTPPSLHRQPSLHPVTTGIPDSRSARASTIVTTSRPSSRGILNIKSSEYDLKVSLLGLNHTSVQPMIEKYMKLLNKTSAVSDFKGKLANLKLKDIQNAPLLLQQMIWLYCNNYDIGQSRSSIYLNIVNTVLGWEHERMGGDPKLHEFQNKDLEHLPLPKSFDKFVRCQEIRALLLLLGRLAYDAYITGSDSSLVFGRYKLKQLGVSHDGISAILRTGILTEVNSPDPTYEKSRLSFIHTSYLESFAALYICSCYLSKITDVHSSGTPLTILEGLVAVTPKTSVAEILRLENVLIMMCGLVPCLTEHVCECIYKISLSENMDYFYDFVLEQIEKLIFDCLSEHNSVDPETTVKFKQRRLYIHDFIDEVRLNMYLYGLDPTAIETCYISSFVLSKEQYLLSHKQCSLLSSCLSQAVSLQTLKIDSITCTKYECEGHIFDLSNHRKLQSIVVSNSQISVSGINHTCLDSCKISDCEMSHDQCSLLSSALSQAVSLQTLELYNIKCPKDECEGHIIDLTSHRILQSIKLSHSQISVSGINHSCPVTCSISDCELSHEQCSLLSSCLSQAVSLQTLEIEGIECTKDKCEGHIIDLTNHRQLQSIELSNSKVSVSGINHICPVSCRISNCELSHEQFSLLTSYLSQAVSLQTLKIDSIKCTKDKCEGHIIDLTNHRKLQQIKLSWSKISVFSMNHTCLESCEIVDCKLSHEQCTSLSSCLSQATSLKLLKLKELECIEPDCEGHCIECHDIDLTNHNQLEQLSISHCNMIAINSIKPTCPVWQCHISNCNLSHEQCAALCTFLSHANALNNLTLREIKCTEDACEGHIIDLTNHNQLEQLSISNCNIISINGINPTCHIYQCHISNCNLSHEQCTSLCTFLSNAKSLSNLQLCEIRCTGYACEGHDIDLTNHNKLGQLSISNCNTIAFPHINSTCPVRQCYISNCNLSHEQCTLLFSFLSNAHTLDNLALNEIKCIEDTCEGHYIELTNHNELEELSISNCNTISITCINPTCHIYQCQLSNCNLSHEQCTSLCIFLSHAKSLGQLQLSEIKCTEDTCEGHDIELTNHNELEELSISNCNTISITRINPTCHIYQCHISNCNLSHEQCMSLCTSLSHANSLENLTLTDIKCIADACEGHDINLTNHNQLKRLSISNCNTISITRINPTCHIYQCHISNCNLSHEQCTSLCTFLSNAKSLSNLQLCKIRCTGYACEGHDIDLNNHNKLGQLSILNCNTIAFPHINSTCPVRQCYISNCNLSHEQCTLLFSFLSNAHTLDNLALNEIKCIEDTCEGHYIELTNHNELEELSISNCNTISITRINPTCHIYQCQISNCNLSHEQCTSLCIFLSHAKSLGQLQLSEIKCTEDTCEGHDIELTNHNELEELSISNCKTMSITRINPTCHIYQCHISYCNLSHEQCMSLCTSLSHAKSLENLTLTDIKCIADACEGHDINLTNHNQLERLSISNCNMISITGINPTLLVT